MRYIGFLTLSAVLLTAAAPVPAQRGGGWPSWMHRMEGLRQAILDGDIHALDVYCRGMKDTLLHSGMRFPAWAMAARDGCNTMRNVLEGSNGNLRRSRLICRDLKRSAKALGKATELPEAPGAAASARSMSRLLFKVHELAC